MMAPQTVLELIDIGGTRITNEELRAVYRVIAKLSDYIWSVAPTPDAVVLPLLCIADTTELDFNGQDMAGLGPLSFESQRGMYLHPTYAWAHAPPAQDTPRSPLGVPSHGYWRCLRCPPPFTWQAECGFWRRSRAAAARCSNGAAHSSQAD
jgi:hypothetical protein